VVAVGLIAYVFWRFTQAFIDPEHQGTDVKRVPQRLGYADERPGYLYLALCADHCWFRRQQQRLEARLDGRLACTVFGQWLVGIVGVFVLGVGLSYLYAAYIAKFREQFELTEMNNAQVKWATWADLVLLHVVLLSASSAFS